MLTGEMFFGNMFYIEQFDCGQFADELFCTRTVQQQNNVRDPGLPGESWLSSFG